jgi:hypothetical protein
MINNNSLKLLLIDKFLQKYMKLANTAIKFSQKHPYRILPFTMKEMIAVIQLIYNKKVQPVHFYIRELNFSFAKLFNKKTLT